MVLRPHPTAAEAGAQTVLLNLLGLGLGGRVSVRIRVRVRF